MPEARVSAEDAGFYREVADAVRLHPDLMRGAGQWLDGYYDPAAAAKCEADRIRAKRQLERDVTGHVVRPKGMRRVKIPRSQQLSLHHRFCEALRSYAQRDADGNLHHLSRQDAARIVLMAWLLTDPDAHEVGLGCTRFEDWPWDWPEDAAGEILFGRGFTANNAFHWRDEGENYAGWLALVKKAMATLPKPPAPGQPWPPAPNEHVAVLREALRQMRLIQDVAQQSVGGRAGVPFQQAHEELRLITAAINGLNELALRFPTGPFPAWHETFKPPSVKPIPPVRPSNSARARFGLVGTPTFAPNPRGKGGEWSVRPNGSLAVTRFDFAHSLVDMERSCIEAEQALSEADRAADTGSIQPLKRESCKSVETAQTENNAKKPYMPVAWFKDEFGLTFDALRGQVRRGNMAAIKRGHWNLYSVPDAMAIWPQTVTYGPSDDTK